MNWRSVRAEPYFSPRARKYSGIGRSGKVVRRVVGLPDNTSAITDQVLAYARVRDPKVLVAAICDERLAFLKSLKTWPVFGRGWTKRVAQVRTAALAMADKAAGRRPIGDAPSTSTPGKGVVPVNDAARKGSAGGAIATGGAAAQQSAASGADWITVALIIVAALAIAVGAWAFWRWRQKRQQEAPA